MHHDGFDTGGQRLEQRLEWGGYGTGSKAAELGYHFHNSGFRFGLMFTSKSDKPETLKLFL
jgi:hypothetical protein